MLALACTAFAAPAVVSGVSVRKKAMTIAINPRSAVKIGVPPGGRHDPMRLAVNSPTVKEDALAEHGKPEIFKRGGNARCSDHRSEC